MDVELVGARRLDRGEHDGQVLGLAAGHHRVDGDLLDGALARGRAARRRRPRRARGSCPSSMRSTRASVGGTTGRPSVQPRSNIASISSSSVGELDAAAAQHRRRRSARAARRRGRGRPTASRSRAGTRAGSAPRPSTPVSASHCGAVPADGALRPRRRRRPAAASAPSRSRGARRRRGRRRGRRRRRAGSAGRPG